MLNFNKFRKIKTAITIAAVIAMIVSIVTDKDITKDLNVMQFVKAEKAPKTDWKPIKPIVIDEPESDKIYVQPPLKEAEYIAQAGTPHLEPTIQTKHKSTRKKQKRVAPLSKVDTITVTDVISDTIISSDTTEAESSATPVISVDDVTAKTAVARISGIQTEQGFVSNGATSTNDSIIIITATEFNKAINDAYRAGANYGYNEAMQETRGELQTPESFTGERDMPAMTFTTSESSD